MAINVLSDSFKGGNKTGKVSAQKREDVAGNSGNAAEAFAATFSGALHRNTKPKGQNSSAAIQNTEGKQDAGDSSTQSQTLSDQSDLLMGYGILSSPFAAQFMLQSDPAGKEADSGNEASQGMGNSLMVNSLTSKDSLLEAKKLGLALMSFFSQSSDEVSSQLGMTMAKSQGDTPQISELDNYKQVIADLLGKLSGEIKDISEKGTLVNSENLGSRDFSQDFVKLIQGWLTAPEDGVQEAQGSFASMATGLFQNTSLPPKVDGSALGSDENSPVLDAKASLLTALSSLLSEEEENAGTKDSVLSAKTEVSALGPDKNNPASNTKTFGQTFLNSLSDSGDEGPKDTALLAKAKGTFNQELVKGESGKSSEPSEANSVSNNQNTSLNIGLSNNIAAANVTDGKTAAIPVYQQISAVVGEQVTNRSQDLKKLDIQLQPADLGKIQIDLRWENGRVHLQVQASQAETGQLLQNQLPDLRQALANQGISCGMLQMGLGGDRQQNSQGNESSKSQHQKANSTEDEDLASILNIPSLEDNGTNQINVTA